MEFLLNWPEDAPIARLRSFRCFLQAMAYRAMQGYLRYGGPKRYRKYLTRMELELEAYKSSGNMEHLLNLANYCWLESEEPQNRKFHHDNTAESVTRKQVGS